MAPFSGNPGFSDATRELLDQSFADIWRAMHQPATRPASADEPRADILQDTSTRAPTYANRTSSTGSNTRRENRSMAVHKFRVGQLVDFYPTRPGVPASVKDYKVLRLLPSDAGMPMYRIKTLAEPYERVAKESELMRRSGAASETSSKT